jgi:hypothetical protein
MRFNLFLYTLLVFTQAKSQIIKTPFEKGNGNTTTTYQECISFYQQLAAQFNTVRVLTFDTTDAGYPLHLILFNRTADFKIEKPLTRSKLVILINNGIHPGEPDGIDASMMMMRDLATGFIPLKKNIIIAIIPIYNIGGALQRNSYSRVSQNGPESFGFRGNAQNLDLNRDFIKNDSKDAQVFTQLFHRLEPDIFIDNHVSDGADYQHTFTLLTTQHNKLQEPLGGYLHDVLEPTLYKGMKNEGWDVCPYVNFEEALPGNGWTCFFDPPRYSSGYAALFSTIALVPETHMLKPFSQRVESNYDFMKVVLSTAEENIADIIKFRQSALFATTQMETFLYDWKTDSSRFDRITFRGYDTGSVISNISGRMRLYYKHDRPFEHEVIFYNYKKATRFAKKPSVFFIPAGWHEITNRLRRNGVQIKRLVKDTTIYCHYYKIDSYKTFNYAFEKHYRHYQVQYHSELDSIRFNKGDYYFYTGQVSDRYVMEVLEPGADDSFFSWNFFDAILQPKEGYSDYRWEDVGGDWLLTQKDLLNQLALRKATDSSFEKNTDAQLYYVYQQSPWFDKGYLRQPVFFQY